MPVPAELMRLWNDYMHEEYGDLDGDFVFVNLWGGRVGRPLSYSNVDRIVERTRQKLGFRFTPHLLRHTYATLLRQSDVPDRVAMDLLGHTSLAMLQRYSHVFDGEHQREAAKLHLDIGL